MIESVRILIEEPEKLRKLCVFLIKFILCTIFTATLYTSIFGQYELLDYTNKIFGSELYYFFISGKILAVALLYFVSKVILFDLIAEIPVSILRGIVNALTKDSSQFKDSWWIRYVLDTFGVMKFDKANRRGTLGKNYEIFHELLSSYENKDVKREIHTFKNSLINETLHTFFVFTVLYFTVLNTIHVYYISILVVIALIALCFYYFALTIILEFFDLNTAELLFGLNIYKQEKLVTDFLEEHHIQIIENRSTQLRKTVVHKGNDYLINFYSGKNRIVSDMVKNVVNNPNNSKLMGIVIITDKPISKTAKKLLKTDRTIKLIFAKSDKKLLRKLEKCFFEK